MKERDPVEEFADKVSDMLDMVRNMSSSDAEIPPDTLARLAKLQHDLAYFRTLTEQNRAKSIESTSEGELSDRQKRNLDKINQLKTDASTLLVQYQQLLATMETQGKPTAGKKPKKGKTMKDKMKPIGTKKNWMKM